MSTSETPRDQTEVTRAPAPGDRETATTVTVRAQYTLCAETTESLRAVTAVGHIESDPGETKRHVAYFTAMAGERDVVPGDGPIALGAGAASPLMVFVPILARLFMALDRGRFDVGWSGYTIGRDVVSKMLHAVAPLVGARSLVDFDVNAPQPSPSELPGMRLFLVTEPDGSSLIKLLASVPDGSLVALLVPPVDASHPSMNFYETVHKKSLTLLGHDVHERDAHRRAVRFATTRLDVLADDFPVQDASTTEKLAEKPPGAILRWS